MTELLGIKIGSTQLYTEDGRLVGVTVIEAGPCTVLAIREKKVQVGFGAIKDKKVKKPILGNFKKLNITPKKIIRDVIKDLAKEYKIGDELKVDLFEAGDFVDVSGVSLGKGFQGGMKRWHWKGGPATHGSTSHRRIGSLGSSTTPGRVFRGHHLPGHMGAKGATIQNLKIIKIDAENNILFVKGAVPGYKNSLVVVRSAKKKIAKKK